MSYHRNHGTSHSHKGHKEVHVASRRVKVLLREGGYKHEEHGGAIRRANSRIAHMVRVEGHAHGGAVTAPRLDKRARGGRIEKFASGGPAVRKFTPSKHKPHLAVNIFNVHRHGVNNPPPNRPVVRPPMAGPIGPGAVPPRPMMPPPGPPGMPMRPPGMKRGGGVPAGTSGLSTASNIKKWQNYSRQNTVVTARARGGKVTQMHLADDSKQLKGINLRGNAHKAVKGEKLPSPRALPEGYPLEKPNAPPGESFTQMKPGKMRHGRQYAGGMGTLEEHRHFMGKWPPKNKKG